MNQTENIPEPFWNHRVIKHTSTYEEILDGMPPAWFSIQEVYYNTEDSTPESHSISLTVEGTTIDELREELNLMLQSLDVEPINEIIDDCGDDCGEEDDKYIYESPDNGETVYRRTIGDYDVENREKVITDENTQDTDQLNLFEE